MDGVVSGSYDVVLIQPFSYNRAIASGYIPLAAMKDPIQAVFLVGEQSKYHAINELKGQVIAMGPVGSALSILGRHALMQAHLVPGHDVTIVYRLSHDACLHEVQDGMAAACVNSVFGLKMRPELTQNLRAIGPIEKVPGVIFLASKRLPVKLRKQLQTEILSWKNTLEGHKILQSLGFGEFVPFNQTKYQQLLQFKEAN